MQTRVRVYGGLSKPGVLYLRTKTRREEGTQPFVTGGEQEIEEKGCMDLGLKVD